MPGINQEFTYREMIIPLPNPVSLVSHNLICFAFRSLLLPTRRILKDNLLIMKTLLGDKLPLDTDEGKQICMNQGKQKGKVWYNLVFRQVYIVVTFQLIAECSCNSILMVKAWHFS